MLSAIFALSAIPLIGGALRVLELAGGPELIPADARFTASPMPVVAHVAGAVVYLTLGAFQFRRRRHRWHRPAGRVLVVAGLIVALSALWMTLIFPRKEGTGDLLYLLRLSFGTGMAVSLILGFAAIRRRDIAAHRAWMIRAFALALAAGTQALTQGFGEGLVGTDVSMGAGWVINLAVAEWIIRRPAGRPRRTALAT
jgi:uncharacterized membrane protein